MSTKIENPQQILHRLGVPHSPTDDEDTYLVRISQNAKNALKDYHIMQKKLQEGCTSEWDSVKGNKVKINDWMGFIVGDTHSSNVELYQVTDIKGPEHRPQHWKSKQYTNQVVQEDVDNREVIIFKNQEPIIYSWNQWKDEVDYSPIYMPRGTTRARHPF